MPCVVVKRSLLNFRLLLKKFKKLRNEAPPGYLQAFRFRAASKNNFIRIAIIRASICPGAILVGAAVFVLKELRYGRLVPALDKLPGAGVKIPLVELR